MRAKRETSLITAIAALAVAVLSPATSSAAETQVTLRFAHFLPPTHPVQEMGIMPWIKSIEEDSGGSIKFEIFPAEQLGKGKDHYDMVRNGIADFAFVAPGYTPGRFPIIAAGELPFTVANSTDGSAALDEWYRQYADKEMADVKLCLVMAHDPGTLHARKKVTVPGDIKGMKIRPANGTLARFTRLLGGASVQVAVMEVRDALERGVADAITFQWNSLKFFGLDKTVKFHMDAPFYVTPVVWVMNKAKYESLDVAQREVIDAHCNSKWAKQAATGWANWEREGRDILKADKDQTVYEISKADLSAWRAAAAPLEAAWASDAAKKGVDPKDVLNSLNVALEKWHAAY